MKIQVKTIIGKLLSFHCACGLVNLKKVTTRDVTTSLKRNFKQWCFGLLLTQTTSNCLGLSVTNNEFGTF